MTLVKEVIQVLEKVAPSEYQEDYDNSGLICGNVNSEVKGIVISVDCTEAVIEETIERGANMVVSHHPIVFRGLKRFTGRDYVERTLIRAIKNDIAIYSIHTNLDNVLHQGTNEQIAKLLGLQECSILRPQLDRKEIRLTVSPLLSPEIENKLNELKASVNGRFDFKFRSTQEGFRIVIPRHMLGHLMALATDYNLSYELADIQADLSTIGAGLIGTLPLPLGETAFLQKLKTDLELKCFRHTNLLDRSVERIAICGGSGSFLLQDALRKRADVYISGDFKYHEFFDAEDQILIADIGHYESERFTMNLLKDILNENFSKFASQFVNVNTNPINYFT